MVHLEVYFLLSKHTETCQLSLCYRFLAYFHDGQSLSHLTPLPGPAVNQPPPKMSSLTSTVDLQVRMCAGLYSGPQPLLPFQYRKACVKRQVEMRILCMCGKGLIHLIQQA